MRFNTDLNTMEFYNGNEWRQFTYISDIQNSPQVVVVQCLVDGNSQYGVVKAHIDFVNISTLGNAQDFGDLTQGYEQGTVSHQVLRGIFGGGYNASSR